MYIFEEYLNQYDFILHLWMFLIFHSENRLVLKRVQIYYTKICFLPSLSTEWRGTTQQKELTFNVHPHDREIEPLEKQHIHLDCRPKVVPPTSLKSLPHSEMIGPGSQLVQYTTAVFLLLKKMERIKAIRRHSKRSRIKHHSQLPIFILPTLLS